MIARGTPGVGTSRMCERHPAKCFSFDRSPARSFGRPRVLACALSIALKRAGEQPAAPSRLSDAGSHPVTCLLLENVGRTLARSRARARD